jgi:hypothetical protein
MPRPLVVSQLNDIVNKVLSLFVIDPEAIIQG